MKNLLYDMGHAMRMYSKVQDSTVTACITHILKYDMSVLNLFGIMKLMKVDRSFFAEVLLSYISHSE